MDKMNMCTPDIAKENYDKLAALFPDAVTETIDENGKVVRAVDSDILMQEINEQVVSGNKERYQFTWPDKKQAIVLANTPTTETLRFEQEKSVGRDGTEGGTDSQNIYIEGDNLEALKLLRNTYLGKVKMIYIDPPYNTGSDFVYRDAFAQDKSEYLKKSGQYDENGNILKVNPESDGRFHTNWLNMIYPRLRVAKDVLSDEGIIFISIDDNEYDNLKKICDEVFGMQNFIANIVWQSTPGSNTGVDIITVTEYILVYAKNKSESHINMQPVTDDSKYTLSDEYEEKRGRYILNKMDRRMTGPHYSEALNYPIEAPDGTQVYPGGTTYKGNENWNYRWSKSKVEWGIKNGFVVFKNVDNKWNVYFKQYFKVDNNDNPIKRAIPYQNILLSNQYNTTQGTTEIFSLFNNKFFDYAKPKGLIMHLVSICSEADDIILDFFSGSATTAHALMQLNAEDGGNRKFILVQLPEDTDEKSEAHKAGYNTICDIGEERIRRAGNKIKEETGADIDYGFRCFKVDESNMQDVYYTPAEYDQNMLARITDNIKPDRTPLDLLIQVMLELKVPLDSKVDEEDIAGKKVFSVENGYLIACFDKDLSDDVIRQIAERQPFYAVFRDSSFASDSVEENATEIFKGVASRTGRQSSIRVI